MWIPSHVELVGNEVVNGEARYALLNGSIFDRLLGKTSFVKGIAGKVGFATHWVICSLHSTERITTYMVRGSEGGEELSYLCIYNNVWT
jgi:hypothetical protein